MSRYRCNACLTVYDQPDAMGRSHPHVCPPLAADHPDADPESLDLGVPGMALRIGHRDECLVIAEGGSVDFPVERKPPAIRSEGAGRTLIEDPDGT